MNKTRILLIIAIVVLEIFTIIQFRGKGDSAKSYSLLEEQISSETAVVSELSNELETLKSEITSLSGKIDGVDQEIEDLSNRKAELEAELAGKEEPQQQAEAPAPQPAPEPTPQPQTNSSDIPTDTGLSPEQIALLQQWAQDSANNPVVSAPAGNETWADPNFTVE